MPVIARFAGIVLKMYFQQKEHNPPRIHAFYGACAGTFFLDDGEMHEGDLPAREQALVKRFIERYREKLLVMWETQKFEILPPID